MAAHASDDSAARSDVLAALLELLALERVDRDVFRGRSQDLGWGQIFGGQVVGQALSAAAQTVDPGRLVHSLQAYFLRRGALARPILYQVDRIRDGASFTTRRVVAVQDGEAIFSLSASFQVVEPGFEHQDAMPDVVSPEGLLSERELAARIAEHIPAPMRAMALAARPIELRPVQVRNPLRPKASEPRRQVWLRAARALPDDDALHRMLLAYASDFSFLTTSLDPHAASWFQPDMQVASIDHAMWFHRPCRMDEWLLFDMESPTASGARGLVRGRFFDQRGRLVASAVQEGLIRRRSEHPVS